MPCTPEAVLDVCLFSSEDDDCSYYGDDEEDDDLTLGTLAVSYRDDRTIMSDDMTYADTVASSVYTRKELAGWHSTKLYNKTTSQRAGSMPQIYETKDFEKKKSRPTAKHEGGELLKHKLKGLTPNETSTKNKSSWQDTATSSSNRSTTCTTTSITIPPIKILDRLQSGSLHRPNTPNSASSRTSKSFSDAKAKPKNLLLGAQLKQRIASLHVASKINSKGRRSWNRLDDTQRNNNEGEKALLECRDETPSPELCKGDRAIEVEAVSDRDDTEDIVDSVSNKTSAPFKDAAGAVGAVGSALNIKKLKVKHDAIKKANGMEDVARTHSDMGQWSIAERAYMRALRIKREVSLPDTHSEVIKTLDLLAMARVEQGDFSGAIKPVEEALAARRTKLGADHQAVINQLHSLAFLCRISGDSNGLLRVQRAIKEVCKIPSL